MLDKFPVAPLAITVGLMAADGLVASYDIDAWAKKNAGATPAIAPGSSPPLLKSKALWLQGGALAVGVIGEVLGWHPDYTEPLLTVPAGLMAREAAMHFAQGRQTNPATVQGYRAQVAAPFEPLPRAAVGRPLARGAVNTRGTGTRQPSTLAG